MAVGKQAQKVQAPSVAPHAQFASSTADHPFQLVHNCPGGERVEAMGVVMRRCEPGTPGTKRAVLRAIITAHLSTRAEGIERHFACVEEPMGKYSTSGRQAAGGVSGCRTHH